MAFNDPAPALHKKDRLDRRVNDAFTLIGDTRDDFRRLKRAVDNIAAQVSRGWTTTDDHHRRLADRVAAIDARLARIEEALGLSEPEQLTGKAEGAMSHVTRPADDDASEWQS